MSHWTNIKTQVRDLNALAAAIAELPQGVANGQPCQLIRAQPGAKVQARGYGSGMVDCDAMIRLPGPYDVALTRQPDGTYTLTTDFWRGHVAEYCGENFGRLLQLYGVHATLAQARKMGCRAQRVLGKNGSINVVITGRL